MCIRDRRRVHGILDEQGWSAVNLRDKRYDAVLHMVTAAEGAPEFYLSESGFQSGEDILEDAVNQDKKTINAWLGHPHLKIIDNSEKGFDKKMIRCLQTILKFIGLPVNHQTFKKYLVENDFQIPAELKQENFTVEEIFLKHEDPRGQNKIRRRGQYGSYTYVQSIRQPEKVSGQRVDVKRQITAGEYMALYQQRDQRFKPVYKKRTSFIWENETYVVDVFLNACLLYTSPSPRDRQKSRMPSSA
eukprot:TRINITY_DN6472_c0_g1_i2.p1 TRINITY_DN6472_c0_g1~~TRINITY_DN6472_c0_g1_i2.p1  ORF type:complete len:245 (+),score=51.05 TRINITY_DN6472_c0_g1_i2:66-800(+)